MSVALDGRQVTAADLAGELEGGDHEIVIVDVRAAGEVERWKVEGAREVPRIEKAYWDVLGAPEVLAADIPEGAIAIVVCAYGNTSEIIAEELRAIGVDARNLEGGMVAWGRLHVARTVIDEPDGLYVEQLDRIAKGCLSYVVGVRNGPALVIDPDRFHEDHLAVIDAHGSMFSAVVDTHLHADHVSGAAALAAAHSVPYFLTDDGGASVDHVRPSDGEVIFDAGGALTARAIALHAPGHTPGSMGALVGDRLLFSGDTLFVEGVGRPDLGGRVDEWARDLHRTLTERLAALPDDIAVLPAHYQSRGERNADGIYAAPLRDLRRHAEFTITEETFVADVIANARPAPEEYATIRKVNLGIEQASSEILDELETGKNQCAAGGASPAA